MAELLNDQGGWYFNSSIAEQTNVWIAGHNAMCRQMTPDKYDFFLDEQMVRRNLVTEARLAAAGHCPTFWDWAPSLEYLAALAAETDT